jgi:hypothetical protein
MREKITSADNQQATLIKFEGASETTCQAPSDSVCRAYLQGALHDGTFNKYNQRYRFSQIGTDWLNILKSYLKITKNSSWIYKEGSNRKVYVLETRAKFLDTKFNPMKLVTLEEKAAYLRGFFDAEGGISKNAKARFYIQLVQNNKDKLEKIKILLEAFGIQTGKIHNPSFKIDPDYFRMFVLSGSKEKFLKEIGTCHPKKIRILKRRMMI